MNIKDAIDSTSRQNPYITRRAWKGIIIERPCRAAIKVQATDSPDGCIVISASAESFRTGWAPRLADLQADDWEVTGP
ncbi:Thoeris anti-defense Tad2 family protein [Anaerotruncus massiliensis (ex Liu et al. 2021)]|uniref:Thoeris anti-defense Tad2 family protein n=1 Tax=Anaerotruncus TaxID=244127 RepID=UPI003F5A7E39